MEVNLTFCRKKTKQTQCGTVKQLTQPVFQQEMRELKLLIVLIKYVGLFQAFIDTFYDGLLFLVSNSTA